MRNLNEKHDASMCVATGEVERSVMLRRYLVSAIRYGLMGIALLAPASVVTTVSCGANCSARCENKSVLTADCLITPATDCPSSDGCVVRTGCHCEALSSSNLLPTGCDVVGCAYTTTQSECMTKTGCAWGDACQDDILDCHTMNTNESACKGNSGCYWSQDC
jgi:hypothetical protein